jgi:polyhydroxybutyrate depolymerase
MTLRQRFTALLLVCAALLVPARGAAAACDGAATASGLNTVDVAGAQRIFVVRLPAGYDGRTAAPVVLAFHPFGMSAQYMQSRVPVSRAWREAIAVYPEGMGREGGNPAPAWQSRPGDLGDRDLKFFDAMLAWLAEHACIDRRRVFLIGYSNGAQLAHVLACERGDAIAAVASASGRLNCRPGAAKPIVMSHGTQDRTIPYEQAVDASQKWAVRNGCAAPPKSGVPGCFAADACSAAPTMLCTYVGGHEYNLPFTATAVGFFKSLPAR